MNRPTKKPAILTAGGTVASPYTDHGDRKGDVVNSSEGAAIRALDRKLTDGLNLVHGQLAVMRDERREGAGPAGVSRVPKRNPGGPEGTQGGTPGRDRQG